MTTNINFLASCLIGGLIAAIGWCAGLALFRKFQIRRLRRRLAERLDAFQTNMEKACKEAFIASGGDPEKFEYDRDLGPLAVLRFIHDVSASEGNLKQETREQSDELFWYKEGLGHD